MLSFKKIEDYNIHIWHISTANSVDYDKFSTILSDDEKNRAYRYRFAKDKKNFIVSKGCTRLLLSKYLDIDSKRLQFGYTKYNKPYLIGEDSLRFNVSHSENQIVIGFCKGLDIGVDVESIKVDFDPLELAENFFSEKEIGVLANTSKEERFHTFFRCWTRKEAFIKAIGEGLSHPLDTFAVSMHDDHEARFLEIQQTSGSIDEWNLHSFVPEKGYIAALAVKGPIKKIQHFQFEPKWNNGFL